MGVYYSHYLIPRDNTIRPSPDRIAALLSAWGEQGFIVGPSRAPGMERHWLYKFMVETGACFRTEPSLVPPVVQEQPPPEPPKSFWSKLFGGPSPIPRTPRPDPMTPFSIPPDGVSRTALSQPDVLILWSPNPDALYPMDTVAAHPVVEPHSISIELSDDYINPLTDQYGSIDGDAKQVDGICACGRDLNYEAAVEWIDSRRIRRICPECHQPFRPQDHAAEIVDGATGTKIPQPGGLCRRFAISIYFGRDLPTFRRDASGELINAKPKTSDLFLKTCEIALGFELNGFDDYN